MKKNLITLFICFVIIMITPASAVQINILSGSDESTNINDKYPNPSFQITGSNNSKTITHKVSTAKNTLSNGKNNEINAEAIDHANELLPMMEESYQNNSEDISAAKEAICKLESEKLNTTQALQKIESKLDDFEVSSNNTNSYNSLRKEKNEFISLKKSLEVTESSIKRMKGILYQKQSHTQNCVVALKQIKKSENIQGAVKTYNKNIECLSVISSNMAAEIQQQKNVILYSNNTSTNNTNSTATNSSEVDSSKVTNILKYAGIGTISATGAVSIASIISIIVYGVTTTKAVAALEAAGIASALFESASATAVSSAEIFAAQTPFLASVASDQLAAAAVSTAATAGLVSSILVATAVFLVVAAVAVTIAYFGFKNHWW